MLESENGRVALADTGPIVESVSSEPHQTEHLNQENSLGTPLARRGYPKMGFMIIWY
jgi:hypothetical protein